MVEEQEDTGEKLEALSGSVALQGVDQAPLWDQPYRKCSIIVDPARVASIGRDRAPASAAWDLTAWPILSPCSTLHLCRRPRGPFRP